jgi:hypothetical protein
MKQPENDPIPAGQSPQDAAPRGQALREYEETRELGLSPVDEARERFVHGLMWAQQEARGAAVEARISRLRERLDEPQHPSQASATGELFDPAPKPRRIHPWQRASIAAAALIFLALGVSGWLRTDEPEALALAEQAIADTERGVHVYEARLMLYDKVGRVQRERIWRIALAPEGRYHVTLRRQRLPISIASDGTNTWMLPPRGRPMLIPEPKPIEQLLGGIGPELSYYQLRPLLRRLLESSDLDAKSYERDPSGRRFAVLEGRTRSDDEPFENLDAGGNKLRLVIGTGDGRLAELEAWKQRPDGRSYFQVRRSRIPEDLAAAGISFETPKNIMSLPGMGLGMMFGQYMAERERKQEERRRGSQAQDKRTEPR